MKKHMWVLSLASLAFVVNVVFVSSIAFDDSAWEAADPATLRATLSLQITYFVLQWFYIPMLLSRSRSMLAWTQGLLGVCSGLQVVSAVLAGIHGVGYARYLNIYPALWTTCFDFLIYSFGKPDYAVFNWLDKYTISLYDYTETLASDSSSSAMLL